MTKLLFWIEDHGEDIEDAEEFESNGCLADAAEEYADYTHSMWSYECSFPIIFSIADESGKLLGKVSVEREPRPVFMGTEITEKKTNGS